MVFFVVIFSVSFSIYCYSNLRVGLEEKAKTTTDFFGNYISQSYNEYYQSCIRFAQTFEEKNNLELQFISTSGKIVASSYGQWAGQAPETSDIADAIATGEISHFMGRNPHTGERILAVSSPMIYVNGEVIGVLRYVTSLRNVDKQIVMAVGIAVLLGILFIAFVLYSSRFFIRSILEPVSEITATAKRIASGSYGARIQKHQDDEIGELADTINDMSAKIAQSEKMQSEFISSVSHELRTPLTAIKGWAETLMDDSVDRETTKKGIGVIIKESDRLSGMVEELLDFSRLQSGRLKLSLTKIDLVAELSDAVLMFTERARQEGIALNYDEPMDILPIMGDSNRLRQVFVNILDNALKYSDAGDSVTVTVQHSENNAIIQIRDTGIGIASEDLPKVKTRFYKANATRRGSGIGLAVADEIVSMHGGNLSLDSQEGEGTTVTISLPLAC